MSQVRFLLFYFVFGCIWLLMLKASIFTSLILLATSAEAQSWKLLSAEEQAPWAAVGKLIKGQLQSDKFCTATLIAADLILTAGHCIAGARNDTPSQLRRYTFLAGWNDDEAAGSSSIAEIILSKNYDPTKLSQVGFLNHDWALVRLTDPITDVQPLPVVGVPGPWEPVYFLTYSGLNSQSPLLTSGCDHYVLDAGPLHINCPVRGGNSGAAVLVGTPDDPQIVGIISSKAENTAIAVIPDEELLALLEERL